MGGKDKNEIVKRILESCERIGYVTYPVYTPMEYWKLNRSYLCVGKVDWYNEAVEKAVY